MPSVSEAVGQFAGAVREVLGLTRHSRLRHQIDDTLDLFGKAKSHPELGQAAVFLGAAVQEQSRQLLVSILPGRRRKWNWSAFLGGLFVVAIAAGVDWLLWQLSDHWWVL